MTDRDENDAVAGGLHVGERVRLMRDGLVQNVALIGSSLIGVLIVPMLLHGLGTESYGLLLTATGVAALIACVDLGLGMSIVREVAASSGEDDAAAFVLSAGNVLLLTGIVGGALVVAAGFAMRGGLHLDANGFRQAPWVFALTGVGLCADLVTSYATSVLSGLRRFGTASQLSLAAAVVRATGFVLLLRAGDADLVGIVAWQTVAACLAALTGLAIVRRLAPHFALRPGRFDWTAVRTRTRFALANQVGSAAGHAMWRGPPIVIGLFCGTSLVAPFSVAQRLPLVVEVMLWRISDVLVPTVRARQHDRSVIGEVLGIGTRWIMVLALPLSCVVFIAAPELIRAWLTTPPTDSVVIFRLAVVTVLVEGVSHTAENVLWGAGLTRSVVIVTVVRAAVVLVLCGCLIPFFGIIGAGAAILVGISIGTVLCVRAAASHCGVGMIALFGDAVRGLMVPVALCSAATWASLRLLPLSGWLGVGCSLSSAAIVYVVGLSYGSARPEERALARQLLGAPVALVRYALRRRT